MFIRADSGLSTTGRAASPCSLRPVNSLRVFALLKVMVLLSACATMTPPPAVVTPACTELLVGALKLIDQIESLQCSAPVIAAAVAPKQQPCTSAERRAYATYCRAVRTVGGSSPLCAPELGCPPRTLPPVAVSSKEPVTAPVAASASAAADASSLGAHPVSPANVVPCSADVEGLKQRATAWLKEHAPVPEACRAATDESPNAAT